MERIEYRGVIDKSDWPRGAWDNEPDKIQWQDEATGLPCLIVRGPSGSLCGYLGVPPEHPWHGKDYDSCEVEVHGGLTFADGCAQISPEKWEKWRERQDLRRAEAKKYPVGDAARDLKEYDRLNVLNDYDAWARWSASRHICHIAAPGEPDPVWWLGFDCAHAWDISPAHARFSSSFAGPRDVYRDQAYVENECRSLAKQIAAVA